jgi:DNA-binding response OmpR family regulator
MTQYRILLVDDDPQIRAFVGAALKARQISSIRLLMGSEPSRFCRRLATLWIC